MKVTRSISLAASGDNGLGLTHPLDCNAWLIDSGEGLILVDAGVNLDNLRIEEEIAADGYRLSDIRYLVVTHAHADHAAGVPHFLRSTGARLVADAHEAGVLGDQSLLDRTMAEYIEAGLYPEGFSFPGAPAGQIVRDGERLRLGRLELTCLVLPGTRAADSASTAGWTESRFCSPGTSSFSAAGSTCSAPLIPTCCATGRASCGWKGFRSTRSSPGTCSRS